MSEKISFKELPKDAYKAISPRQRTYLDEFNFRKYSNGLIEAEYAGESVGVWDGKGWR